MLDLIIKLFLIFSLGSCNSNVTHDFCIKENNIKISYELPNYFEEEKNSQSENVRMHMNDFNSKQGHLHLFFGTKIHPEYPPIIIDNIDPELANLDSIAVTKPNIKTIRSLDKYKFNNKTFYTIAYTPKYHSTGYFVESYCKSDSLHMNIESKYFYTDYNENLYQEHLNVLKSISIKKCD
jgi:hypothetical protein